MEDVKRQAKEIVNCDQLWSRLSVDAKLNTLRISMGLPKRCESTPISSETPEYKSLVEREDEARWWEERRKKSNALLQEMGQIIEAMKTTQNQVNERTLYVKVYLEEYLISCDILNQVFSSVGDLEAIEKFDDGAEFHSRIRFQNRDSALKAFNWFNGRCIYDGCCRMKLNLGSRTDSRFNRIEAPIEGASSDRLNEIEAPIEDANSIEDANQVEEVRTVSQKLEQLVEFQQEGIEQRKSFNSHLETSILIDKQPLRTMGGERYEVLGPMNSKELKVTLKPLEAIVFESESEKMGEIDVVSDVVALEKMAENASINSFEITWDEFKESSFEFLADSSASNVFDKMPMRSAPLFVGNWVVHQHVFDPGISKGCRGKQALGPSENFISCDNWFQELLLPQMCSQESVKVGSCTLLVGYQILVFDPGGIFCHDWVHYNSTYAAALVCICWVLGGLIFVWDPGGVVQPCLQVLTLS